MIKEIYNFRKEQRIKQLIHITILGLLYPILNENKGKVNNSIKELFEDKKKAAEQTMLAKKAI